MSFFQQFLSCFAFRFVNIFFHFWFPLLNWFSLFSFFVHALLSGGRFFFCSGLGAVGFRRRAGPPEDRLERWQPPFPLKVPPGLGAAIQVWLPGLSLCHTGKAYRQSDISDTSRSTDMSSTVVEYDLYGTYPTTETCPPRSCRSDPPLSLNIRFVRIE